MTAPSPDTSASLLERARAAGDDGAWRALVSLYTPLLHVWLGSAGLQPADRDDLTQRTLEVLVRQLPTFQHTGRTGAFRAWLRGITTNLLREFWRTRPTPASESVLEQLADPGGRLSVIWDEQHDRHVLHALLDQIRPEFESTTWAAFQRTALDGAAPRAVAAELGITTNAVFIAKSRVLARLRERAAGLVD
jgi:RNA polymerase sigma-70 factor (ECF subfamily)